MSYSFDYAEFQPELISISLSKEDQMPNPKTGGNIAYKTGQMSYAVNGIKHKLVIRGPECKTKSGLYINKDDEKPAEQSYNQPTISGYQNQQMFNPGAMAPKKFKKKVSASIPVELDYSMNTDHKIFADKLNALTKIVNDKYFELKNFIYANSAVTGQQIMNKPLVSYPVNSSTMEPEYDSNPTIWFQVKKFEDQMNKVFLMPNKTYASYKDLIGITFTGIPIFSFSMFFNGIAKTCKMNIEGFVVTNVEVSAVANELMSIADKYNELDPSLADRVTESLKKITDSRCKADEEAKASEQQEPKTFTDIPVVMPPQSIINPQTYQPQTPIQPQYDMSHRYGQQFSSQPTPHSFLK